MSRSAPNAPLSESISIAPFPASRKIYIEGSRSDLRVPLREIALSATRHADGREVENPPHRVYDTSGPWTDPEASPDARRGLPALRRTWQLERGDVEELSDLTSE